MIKNILNLGDAAAYCDFGSEVNETINNNVINYFNQIYLFNKVSEKLLITNLKNKKTLVLQTNSFFKLLNNNFYLTSDCMTIIPIVNRKVYNNINGQSINYFEPIISS